MVRCIVDQPFCRNFAAVDTVWYADAIEGTARQEQARMECFSRPHSLHSVGMSYEVLRHCVRAIADVRHYRRALNAEQGF